MKKIDLIRWLLAGDVSIQYQAHRDLLNSEKKELRERISKEGWGAQFLRRKNEDGYWGRGFYQPKWTSTHYTLLDLKNLGISPRLRQLQVVVSKILRTLKSSDGGIYPIGKARISDVCLNGMFLNYAAYFRMKEEELQSIIDFLLREHMGDGGFNCFSNRRGASHSSLHSTVSVLDGFLEYSHNGYTYRVDEIEEAGAGGREFLLHHRLFRSDRTGEIIDKKMVMLSYPSRWRYDILRGLDYFRLAGSPYDPRMDDALNVLRAKKRADNTWPLQAKHPGRKHFDMEKSGKPSRWNTLRALRVLKHFGFVSGSGSRI